LKLSARQLQILDRELLVIKSLIFALKFPYNLKFLAPKKIFQQKEHFPAG